MICIQLTPSEYVGVVLALRHRIRVCEEEVKKCKEKGFVGTAEFWQTQIEATQTALKKVQGL